MDTPQRIKNNESPRRFTELNTNKYDFVMRRLSQGVQQQMKRGKSPRKSKTQVFQDQEVDMFA